MDGVIFRLVEPCEVTFSFEVIDCSNLEFNFVDACENSFIFEEICLPYVEITFPTYCQNIIKFEELELCPELVFNWTCKVGEDYIYFITLGGEYFNTSDDKKLIVQKII